METNLRKYLRENYNNFREIFARIKAFLNVDIFNSKPKYL
jgi:vancomycin permeability regulator SanA